MNTAKLTKEEYLAPKWRALEEHFNSRGADGAAVVEGFRELYKLYSDELPVWLAKLYDHERGGFYYSNSARDNEPFLPDIESTNQALNLMLNSGMMTSCSELPESMRKKLSAFVCSLQDKDDGYIYHPQWGKDIVNSRRGRDAMWADDMAHKLNFTLPYPTANQRLADLAKSSGEEKSKKAAVLPDHLTSKENFVNYLESFDWVNNSYYAGNMIAAQGRQIIAAGLADVCAEYLNKYQNEATGYWSDKADMHTGVNGFLKITAFYIDAKIPINMAERAALSTIECTKSDEVGTTVCHLYNCWYALQNIIISLRRTGEDETADRIMKLMLENAPASVGAARKKTEVFRKADGAFSYHRACSSFKSQEAWVCLKDMPESDVNASVLCTSGLTRNIYQALGASEYYVPIYTYHDFERFIDALDIPDEEK